VLAPGLNYHDDVAGTPDKLKPFFGANEIFVREREPASLERKQPAPPRSFSLLPGA